MSLTINDLGSPEWQMDDAYVDIGAPRYEASFAKAESLIEALEASPADDAHLEAALKTYDEALTITTSLSCFLKCLGAKNSDDERVGAESARLNRLSSRLTLAGNPIFKLAQGLPAQDERWKRPPLSDWAFVIAERARDWHERLSESDRAWLAEFESRCFLPQGALFKTLQKGVDFAAKNAKGEDERIRAAKLVAVIKGAPDRTLRRNVSIGMTKSYAERAPLYAALLSNLHGFRLAAFGRAGMTPLEVSLAQNRMSREALEAMRAAIQSRIETVREAVALRAPYFGAEKLAVYDLMAPAPARAGAQTVPELIPYRDAVETVKAALGSVDPKMSAFIYLMLERRWVDAKPSDKKIGGAFYSRFNEFRMPRVFTSFMGTITTLIQQAHELGHAFHYWTIRDLPVVQTEFPMTLTETASTFNEALVRRWLLAQDAEGDGGFSIRWQALRSAANFLLNTMVRMDFELAFFQSLEKGPVSAGRCVELMREAWRSWYGDSTEGADDYLWAYKLHYYKTDQLIYNYPYTVGYLLSEGLLTELDRRGKDFMPFYEGLLRDTGRATVDEIVSRHYGADAKDPAFWLGCMRSSLESIEAFKRDFAKTSPQ